jgi:hypothetical protein
VAICGHEEVRHQVSYFRRAKGKDDLKELAIQPPGKSTDTFNVFLRAVWSLILVFLIRYPFVFLQHFCHFHKGPRNDPSSTEAIRHKMGAIHIYELLS